MDKCKLFVFAGLVVPFLVACAGERQGMVCSEIQYRLDTQTYSPDQRAYIEEELRVCREDEAKKRGEDAAFRGSIYERYANSDSTKSVEASDSTDVREVSVSEALKDSSGQSTVSIYDRYGAAGDSAPIENPAENSSDEND